MTMGIPTKAERYDRLAALREDERFINGHSTPETRDFIEALYWAEWLHPDSKDWVQVEPALGLGEDHDRADVHRAAGILEVEEGRVEGAEAIRHGHIVTHRSAHIEARGHGAAPVLHPTLHPAQHPTLHPFRSESTCADPGFVRTPGGRARPPIRAVDLASRGRR